MLGNVEELPAISANAFTKNWETKQKQAQELLADANIEEAWQVLVS